jgi:hypothetical protein
LRKSRGTAEGLRLAAFGLRPPQFWQRAGIQLTGLALPELCISQLHSCATAVKGRQWPVVLAHG